MLGYAIARPTVESLFLESAGSRALPLVWLLVMAGATAAVALYHRAAEGAALGRLLSRCALWSLAVLVALLALGRAGIPGAPWALYVWKDVYVVVLVEIFWSFANVVFRLERARWLYGLFLTCGSLGGIVGNLCAGSLVGSLGPLGSLTLVGPTLLLVALGGRLLAADPALRALVSPGAKSASVGTRDRAAGEASPGLLEGLVALRHNRYLALLLALVVVVQVAITLVDFQFNAVVERSVSDTAARARIIGQVYAANDAGAILLQLLSGLIFRLAGVAATVLAVPVLLLGALGAFLLSPGLAAVAVLKVASKCFDYSLLRAGKELLYLPLSVEDKVRGKALIDMLGYRVAKGGAALLLLGLALWPALGASLALALTALAICAWIGLSLALLRRYRRLVPRAEGLGAATG